jgi:hypothetical protein
MSRFTSAGFAQLAALICRTQAMTGSRASSWAGLRARNAFSVLTAMILTKSI